VTHSEFSYITSRPNNSIILTDTSSQRYYSSRRRMAFYCCSNSTSAGTYGAFIGLNNIAYSGRIRIGRESSSSSNAGCMYFYFNKHYRSSSQNTLGTSEQGIYTCRMPDATGRSIDVSVGIYQEGYRGKLTKKFSPHKNYETLTGEVLNMTDYSILAKLNTTLATTSCKNIVTCRKYRYAY